MARLVALGVAVVVVAFGAAFGISRAASGGGSTAHAAKPPATAKRAALPVRDTALAASFSGQLVSLKLPPAPKRHAHKAARHHAAAKAGAASSSSGSSAAASSSSAPSTSTPSSTAPSAAQPEISPAMPSIGSGSSGGSSGATHHASHHHSGSGSGTITIP